MAQFIKHVGINGQGKKIVVVFREVPGDPESALVIPTESLPSLYHDDLIRAIESTNCQDSMDPSDWLFRQVFHDGTNMLNTIHQRGWMVKVPTKSVVMTPRPGVDINLVDLNQELKQISRERAAAGTTRSNDIASNNTTPGVITDEVLAAKYRAQANTFEIEVRRLREEAEKLDPKGAVAVVLASQPSQPSTEVKRGRGRPPKVQAVA
ncbi:hypothetical protein UFOVP71_435 [uncultured Caudovirales phage]|uniref:Uncharacterized protein n=1 Tax=uncultured Caudovirales phage TaxID=2100421 RepID=A0A6J5TD91_9CAUD|nr:hypothetical protein UFOVP71_435 [uncultured Caudovirales phage]